MENLPTSKSSLVDMNTYLKLRITEPVRLIKDFGPTWYESNLKEQYKTIVRNETRKHQMEELLTNSTVMDSMEVDIRKEVSKVILSAKLPVMLEDLSMGKVSPNAPVIIEMDLTAAATQRKKTMVELEQSEIARKKSEEARAEADNAYREKMKLSPAEFVQIEVAKRYSEVCAKKEVHCIINANGNSSVLLQR